MPAGGAGSEAERRCRRAPVPGSAAGAWSPSRALPGPTPESPPSLSDQAAALPEHGALCSGPGKTDGRGTASPEGPEPGPRVLCAAGPPRRSCPRGRARGSAYSPSRVRCVAVAEPRLRGGSSWLQNVSEGFVTLQQVKFAQAHLLVRVEVA